MKPLLVIVGLLELIVRLAFTAVIFASIIGGVFLMIAIDDGHAPTWEPVLWKMLSPKVEKGKGAA